MAFTSVSAMDFLNRLIAFDVVIDVCTINKQAVSVQRFDKIGMKDVQEQKKDSTSPTVIYFAQLVSGMVGIGLELPVVVKLFRNITDKNDPLYYQTEGLRYEYKVYRQILTDIVQKNYSPNFVPFVAYGCCKKDNVCLLITERVGNGAYFGLNKMFPVYTLHSIFTDLSNRDQAKILFQIIYSVQLLTMLKIVHNDLHANNILVVDFGRKIRMKFTVGVKSFVINTQYVPYLYDWDTAYSQTLGPNEKLLVMGGLITNTFDSYRDLYTVFCNLNFVSKHVPKTVETYSKTDLMKLKEGNIPPIILSKREVVVIRQRYAYVQTDDNFVYKMSRAEFDDVVKQSIERGLPGDIYTVYFEIRKDEHGKYMLVLWNPFQCRMTSTSKKFPTPLQLLENDFEMFESDEDSHFKYTLPFYKEEHIIDMDIDEQNFELVN